MLTKLVFFTIFVVIVQGFHDLDLGTRRVHPDAGLNVKQLIEKYGYPFENHTVETEDGYLLEIHRIPYGRNSNIYQNGPPVLVVPGVLCSSADWVNMGPQNSLGFILADQGYDVWLANYRGTRWSRKHVKWNPDHDKKEFWSYSFQQIGYYDLPAFIDYILKQTNQEQLFYIGHSQGTTSLFALNSVKPEYNSKIRLATTLAPVAYGGHMKSPLVYLLAALADEIEELVNKYQIYEILPYTRIQGLLARLFCHDESPFQNICAAVFFIAGGYTPDQFNKTMIPVIATNTPAGASIRQMQHYAQLLLSQKFQHYDYGEEENLAKYGQSTPPEYDLSKVTTPIAFYSGLKDPMCAKEDLDRTVSEVANAVVDKRIKGFNHLDVMWGIDVVKEIFNDIVALMKKY